MSEKFSFEKPGGHVEKPLIDLVREQLISDLKKALESCGPDWVNKEACLNLVEDLENKAPLRTRIDGPFFGDYVDAALYYAAGLGSDDKRYQTIVEQLKAGETDKASTESNDVE